MAEQNRFEKKYDYYDMAEAYLEGALAALRNLTEPDPITLRNQFEVWLEKDKKKNNVGNSKEG